LKFCSALAFPDFGVLTAELYGMVRAFVEERVSREFRRENESSLGEAEVLKRRKVTFSCQAIVVTKEPPSECGFHFHAAVKNNNASKHTTTKLIRGKFPGSPMSYSIS
jgi:Cu/Zn superoxide dismutase